MCKEVQLIKAFEEFEQKCYEAFPSHKGPSFEEIQDLLFLNKVPHDVTEPKLSKIKIYMLQEGEGKWAALELSKCVRIFLTMILL